VATIPSYLLCRGGWWLVCLRGSFRASMLNHLRGLGEGIRPFSRKYVHFRQGTG
jgi:hypothetical protein